MLNYIKSELYRTKKRRYTSIVFVLFTLGAFASNLILKYIMDNVSYPDDNGIFSLTLAGSVFLFAYYMVAVITDIVFSDEHKYQTLKNSVSFGISRNKIYIGKFLAQLIVAMTLGIVVMLAYILSLVLAFGTDVLVINEFQHFIQKAMLSVPLIIGGLALSNMLVFLIRNNTAFALTYFGIGLLLPPICKVLSFYSPIFKKLEFLTIGPRLNEINYGVIDSSMVLWALAIGGGYVVLTSLIGMRVFDKMEIK